jgi:FlaA1/EpsC-like NDP-sugar epimerase
MLAARLGELPRSGKRILLVVADLATLAFAMWASFSLRLGEFWWPPALEALLILKVAPLLAIPIFAMFGLYRAVIRFLAEQAIWRILQATTLATLVWVLVIFLSPLTGYFTVPRSVPLIYWIISTVLVAGSRYAAKQLLWSGHSAGKGAKAVIVYGAGPAGAQLAGALKQSGARVIALVDDNVALHGTDVADIRVHPPEKLIELVGRHNVGEVLLSGPGLSADRRQDLITAIGAMGVKVRALPPLSEVISGKYLINQAREIDIDDLLGRSSVPPDPALIREMIEGRTIMVTGAGGSIGSELCRLIVKWRPRRLVLLEANEFALYRIERELANSASAPIVPVLATITDAESVSRAISANGVNVLFHTAAYKHVPLVEANAIEGIRNNVLGTQVVVQAAFDAEVEDFVLISSDKAVRPTNVMGATKRWAEFLVHQKAFEANAAGRKQRFCAVRFGNVLGSNGSVVPLFKEQIAQGGPLTLTDRAMTRYFMSIHEAAELIVQAGALSQGGDLFLLDMGEPILISDLAENIIRLAGLSVRDEDHPDGDIEIVVTGKRPGEKLYEELFYNPANAGRTRHPKILRAAQNHRERGVADAVARLKCALVTANEADARRILFDFIK